MIRINLLAAERKATRKVSFNIGQKLTLLCSLILVATVLLVGWRYWTIDKESKQLDADLAAAQKEAAELKSVLQQVENFDKQKAQLQERVALIEKLRQEQTGPVHMLDQISRALPPALWLTEIKQSENPNEVVISGKCTELTGLTDFVSNLEASGYFKRSIDIVKSETETSKSPVAQLVTFSIRAQFQRPGTAEAPTTAQGDASTGISKG
jgi:type IV pilus assembly protein PilN